MSRSNSDPRPSEQRPVEDDFRQRQASLAAIISTEIAPRLSLLHARVCPIGQELAPHSGPDDVSGFARLVLDPDASIPRRHVMDLRERRPPPERIFVERCCEDDEGLDGEAGEKVESAKARHLDVEEEDIDGLVGGLIEIIEGFGWIRGAGDNFERIEAGQQTTKPLNCEWFVIHEIGSERGGFHGHFNYAGPS